MLTLLSRQVDSLGGLVIALVPGLSALPAPVATALTTLLSWVPTGLMMLCCYNCCCAPRRDFAGDAAKRR